MNTKHFVKRLFFAISVIALSQVNVWAKDAKVVDLKLDAGWTNSEVCEGDTVKDSNFLDQLYICDGDSVRFDAEDFGDGKYTWMTNGDTISDSHVLVAVPNQDYSTYVLRVTRGTCQFEIFIDVLSKSYPRISSIDSLDYRTVEVVNDWEYGTARFRYKVDDREWTENSFIEDLNFGIHFLSIEDANGCVTEDTFKVYPPSIGLSVCEGDTLSFDSHFLDADTYTWTVKGDTDPVSNTSLLEVVPTQENTNYVLHMTRGASNYDEYVDVKVNMYTYPRILSIDSIDYRTVEVVLDPTSVGSSFSIKVDDGEWMYDNTRIEGLTYSTHTIQVENYICVTTYTFEVNAPDLPFHGDGVESILADKANTIVNVYSASGVLIKSKVMRSEALKGLEDGVYLVGGEKVVVKK